METLETLAKLIFQIYIATGALVSGGAIVYFLYKRGGGDATQ